MGFMSLSQKIAFCSLILSLTGCCFPLPWRAERFESGIPFGMLRAPVVTNELQPFFISNFFVQAGIHAENRTDQSANSPYYLTVSIVDGSILQKIDKVDKLILHKIIWKIDGKSATEYEIREKDRSKALDIPFELSKTQKERNYLGFRSTPIEINHQKTKEIHLSFDIEVFSSSFRKRKTISYTFKPLVEGSLFTCVEV